MIPLPVATAGAVAGAAYLSARFSLPHDVLFFRIYAGTLLTLARVRRADRINLFYTLENHARNKTTANRPLILFEGRSHTYAETYDRVLRYSAWLHERLGVRKGDIVALDYQNSDTFIFLWFALWAVGAKPAFINHNLQGPALAHCLRVSSARLAIVDPQLADWLTDDVRGAVPNMNFVVFSPALESEALQQEPVRYPNEVRSESDYINMALLIYTSGTTGMPKPAVVSWAKIYMAANMSAKGTACSQHDVIYTVHSGRRSFLCLRSG
jgi:acyl-CoA synthetase (AMP-forming)/AMP-acid ligase II